MASVGFNFRASLAYVTDPADTHFVDSGTIYPTTVGSDTFGFDSSSGASRDRNATIDPRLAGLVYHTNNASPITFRYDLSATGERTIRLALGDAKYGSDSAYCQILDDTTVIATIDKNGVSLPSSNWWDATGVQRTSATDWVANNATITHTFTSTILRVKISQPISTTGLTPISHLMVEDVASGAQLTPATASLGISGQSVSLARSFTLTPVNGAISVSGQTVDMAFGRSISPSVGSMVVNGQTVTVELLTGINPATGAISLSGQVVDILSDKVISPSLGTLNINGQTVTVAVLTSINPAVGTISIAGETVDITTLRIISPSSATLSINGQSVTVDAVFVQVKETGFIFKLVGPLVSDLIKELI